MSNEQSTPKPTILLVDNGSTRAESTLQLRSIAAQLSEKTGEDIHPVSLKHSDKIAEHEVHQKLAGHPARVFSEFISAHLNTDQRDFILIPLFFGKSRALTSFVPDEKSNLESKFGAFNLTMAEVLYPLPQGDPQFIEMLYQHLKKIKTQIGPAAFDNIVLVDHGTPLAEVNAVRQHIANALNAKMPIGVNIEQAAMERRDGEAYDFNGELLEDYLTRIATTGETQATVLLQFLLPGTHAGEGGDITNICGRVMQQHPNFSVTLSPLIGENKNLINYLAHRLLAVL